MEMRILAIGAHPDDIELGCGGSLAKLIGQGAEVRTLVLSRGVHGGGDIFDRQQETHEALTSLGITDTHYGDFPDTRLREHLNEMIKYMEGHVREFNPRRVFTMFERDRHQDHRAVFEASIVACRRVPQIFCYETPSSWPNFDPSIYESLDEEDMERKVEALLKHHSQADRDYTQPDHLRTAAKFRGQQVGLPMAEGFIPYKLVL